jgi:TatD DNase family protein
MSYRYIDTHAHVNLSAFNTDREEVLARTWEGGVAHINIGTKETTSKLAVEIADANDGAYAIVGLHPIQTTPQDHDDDEIGEGGKPFTSKGETFNKDFYRELAKSEKVVGIGECGFDYYRLSEGRGSSGSSHMTERMKGESAAQWHLSAAYAAQEAAFIAQIELANELGLPLMIHTRGPKPGEESPTGRSVYADVYETLKQYAKVPFNVHFYAGTWEEAERFFELGGTISFTGVITFAKEYEEVVRNAPLEKIHAETDCPFVAPVPHRGKRNEPLYVIEVYKKIAEIKGLNEEIVREQLILNVEKLYQIKRN